jgi:hypothetical protein
MIKDGGSRATQRTCCAYKNADPGGSSSHVARLDRYQCRSCLRFPRSRSRRATTPRNKTLHRRRGCRDARPGHHSDWQAARNIRLRRPRDIACPSSTERPGPEVQPLAGRSEARNRSACQVDSSSPGRAHADWTISARKQSVLILLHRLMQWRPGFGRRGG